MPFLTLNNNWSNLAQYYNRSFNNKPEVPKIKYTAFDDGLIRGGVINAGIASVKDTLLVGNFLKSPKGIIWLVKQVGLQKTNPRLEQPQDFKTLSNNNTRLYNLGVNTIAQVPINAFGGHLIRHGLTPVGGVGFLEGSSLTNVKGYNYEKIAIDNNILQENTIGFFKGYSSSDYYGKNPNRLMQYLSIINNNDTGVVNLSEYNGGAASVYGVGGKTRINTTNIRTTIGKSILDPGFEKKLNGFTPLTNDQIILSPQAELNTSLKRQLDQSPLPKNNLVAGYNIESRIGVSTKKNVDSINAINIVDSVTFYDISEGEVGVNSSEVNSKTGKPVFNSDNVDGAFANDLIKFRIEFLNNEQPIATTTKDGSTYTSINTDVLAFRAYIDSFDDGMQAKWDSYRYMGRGEDFYVYNGFTRDISVSFTMHAHNEDEMAPLYSKLNYLMSAFTPDYSSQLKMRGNIGYLTVGDYLYRQPGVFTDIKLSGFFDGSWEIGLNEAGTGNNQYELPRMLKVGLSFKPIHSFLPRRNYGAPTNNQKFPAPFITPDRKAYPKNKGINKYLDTGGWAPPPEE